MTDHFRHVRLKHARFFVFADPTYRFVRTVFPDNLQANAVRDFQDAGNIKQAESEGYIGPDVVWRSLVDHELLHSIVAEILHDRPSVVLRTEAGCEEFWPLWERYEEEMLVLAVQFHLNTGKYVRPLADMPISLPMIVNRYKEAMK